MDISLDTLATKKKILVDVRADQTVAQALNALHANNILACPVWGQPGGWVGAGNSNVVIQDKQYIGIVSIADLVAFIFANYLYDHESATPPARLHAPVSDALGATEESLTLWVEDHKARLRTLTEILAKGAHRVLVTNGFTKLVSQTDVARHALAVAQARPKSAVADLMMTPIAEMKVSNSKIIHAKSTDKVIEAIQVLHRENITGLPVIDADTRQLLTTFSVSDLRGMHEGNVMEFYHVDLVTYLRSAEHDRVMGPSRSMPTVAHQAGLRLPLVTDIDSNLGEVLRIMLKARVHRIWVVNSTNELKSCISYTDIMLALHEKRDVVFAPTEPPTPLD